jgi:hypothetical protein
MYTTQSVESNSQTVVMISTVCLDGCGLITKQPRIRWQRKGSLQFKQQLLTCGGAVELDIFQKRIMHTKFDIYDLVLSLSYRLSDRNTYYWVDGTIMNL